ncbi:protein misato homolog 1-like isoform X1 [Salvelinus alpinus]|uniref:protein misato homolog 1-like isoform X1 n=1 Tax=Salvelinus alpinus TaxID=8036 RepID=UPI0039FD6BE8
MYWEAHNLEAFGQGEALLQGSVLEDLEDRLHFFIEGYLQRFQVLCDLADGFSGLGSKVTEMLQDSYGGRGILSWGLAPVSHPDTPSLWYHSSSVLFWTPSLCPTGCSTTAHPCGSLPTHGRKVVAAYGALPFPMAQGSSLPDTLDDCANALLWLPLSACPEQGDGHCFGQSVTLKGLELQCLVSLSLSDSVQASVSAIKFY